MVMFTARTRPGDGRTTLKDGSLVLIRPIERTDAPLLVDGFARLSGPSRRSRFLGAKTGLSAADLRYLTDVDHHDHEALVAVGRADGRAVGTARFVRAEADGHGADVAVTVVDEWHRRGVATALIAALVARAEAENVRYFTAHVAEDNLAILRLLQRVDAEVEVVDHASGVLVYRVVNFRHRPAASLPHASRRRQRKWGHPTPKMGVETHVPQRFPLLALPLTAAAQRRTN